MTPAPRLYVHVLVDLEWSDHAGGHVKCWERFAAALEEGDGVCLTLHAAGKTNQLETRQPWFHLQLHKPVFSTRRLPFLGHVPDHTDLAPHHPRLARALRQADVLHSTDGFFAYARTAEAFARKHEIPLIHSVHTDTVAYTELFTRSFLENRFGFFGLDRALIEKARIPQREAAKMQARLLAHQRAAQHVLVSRTEDAALARAHNMAHKIRPLRLGMDKTLFSPAARNRAALAARYGVPDDAFWIVNVGRQDEGKNVYTLIDAVCAARARGAPAVLIAAGLGPATKVMQEKLNGYVATPGFLTAEDLAALYASADVLALPSEVETWSMAAAEALACGLPVLASRGSGVGRFLEENRAGFVVPDGTAPAWAEALHRAYTEKDNPALRAAALAAANIHFPSWRTALAEDLLPLWKEAALTRPAVFR